MNTLAIAEAPFPKKDARQVLLTIEYATSAVLSASLTHASTASPLTCARKLSRCRTAP